jgi:hypothetical protein
MFNKIRKSFVRWWNPVGYVSKHYYSNLPEKQRLSRCYKILSAEEQPTIYTNTPIHFHGVSLSSPGKRYRKTFGRPQYKTKRKYMDSIFDSMVFRHEFYGIKVTSIVNLFDGDMVNSLYYFDISDKPTIRKIKEAIRNKYDIGLAELPDYFVLADQSGGRLIFDCMLNTVVTYFSVNEMLNEKIAQTLKACKRSGQIQGKLRKEELSFAF